MSPGWEAHSDVSVNDIFLFERLFWAPPAFGAHTDHTHKGHKPPSNVVVGGPVSLVESANGNVVSSRSEKRGSVTETAPRVSSHFFVRCRGSHIRPQLVKTQYRMVSLRV